LPKELSETSTSSQDTQQDGILARIISRFSGLLTKNEEEDRGIERKYEKPSTHLIVDDMKSKQIVNEPVTRTEKPVSPTSIPEMKKPDRSSTKMHALYNKYTHLVQERNDIIAQKENLTKKVDLGELTTVQTHNKMVALTREAAQLTEVIREISERLAELGHPRFK